MYNDYYYFKCISYYQHCKISDKNRDQIPYYVCRLVNIIVVSVTCTEMYSLNILLLNYQKNTLTSDFVIECD
jgi:hypothetical protein